MVVIVLFDNESENDIKLLKINITKRFKKIGPDKFIITL